MNQRGEITLLSCLLLVTLMGIVLLSSLQLRKSYFLLQKRTHLFLCAKESKGELHDFLKFMGRTNWGIKNINKAGLISLFIPGLQGVSTQTHKLKKVLQRFQEARVLSYFNSLKNLKNKNCPLDPRFFPTPFKLGSKLLKRDIEGGAILRNKEWNYIFFVKPYLLELKVNAGGLEKANPKIDYQTKERAAKLSSLWSSL